MFTSSTDILNLILAISIAVLTFFLCWAIYYFIVSIQRINRISKKIESSVTKAEEFINMAKDKLKHSSAYFMVLSQLAKKGLEFVQEKRAASQTQEAKSKAKTKSKKK
ncbi:MAG: hypothetical protein WC467_04080 [Patescibacteria group bacterium]